MFYKKRLCVSSSSLYYYFLVQYLAPGTQMAEVLCYLTKNIIPWFIQRLLLIWFLSKIQTDDCMEQSSLFWFFSTTPQFMLLFLLLIFFLMILSLLLHLPLPPPLLIQLFSFSFFLSLLPIFLTPLSLSILFSGRGRNWSI